MQRETEEKIKVSLTKAIKEWMDADDSGDGGTWPWIGDGIAEIMAMAALQVLRGMADGQAYMEREGMLKED